MTADAVLTAAHVVVNAVTIDLRFDADQPGQWSVRANSGWDDADTDIAIVVFTPPEDTTEIEPTGYARLSTDHHELIPVHAVGFPLGKLRISATGSYRESHTATGTVAALSNLRSRTLEVTVNSPLEVGDPAHSPWEGMSGAALWCGDEIIGVLAEHHRAEGVGRLTASSIERATKHGSEEHRRELARLLRIRWPATLPLAAVDRAARRPLIEQSGNIPHPVHSFTGRKTELALIEERLGQVTGPLSIVVLSGIGGVGKTQLAMSYAQAHRGTYRFAWWLPAGTDLARRTATIELAEALGVPSALPFDNLMAQITKCLNEIGDWLLIYDGAPSPDELERFLPSADSGHVLITSRSPAWSGLAELITVDALPESDAVELLLQRSGDDDNAAAIELAGALGRLPLALMQAAQFAADTDSGLAGYLRLYRRRAAGLLADVDQTFLITTERLRARDPAAARLLELCALLAPERIPVTALLDQPTLLPEPVAAEARDERRRYEMVAALLQNGLLIRGYGRALRMHELIRDASIRYMDNESRDENVRSIIETLAATFPRGDEPDAWSRCAELITHAQAVVGAATPDELASPGAATLLQSMGTYLRLAEIDRYQARDLHRQALRSRERLYGEQSPQAAETMQLLTNSLYWTGDYAQAQDLGERTLALRRQLVSGDDKATADLLASLSLTLFWQGERDRGRELGNEALAMVRRLGSQESLSTATNLQTLASGLFWIGDHASAALMGDESLQLSQGLVSGDHPLAAAAMIDLAANWCWTGELERAAEAGATALAMSRRLYTSNHPHVSWCLIVLGDIECRRGNYQHALELHEEGLSIGQRLFQRDRPSIVMSLAGVAEAQRELGNTADAYARATEGLAMARRLFGDQDHLIMAIVLVRAADCARVGGHFDEARDEGLQGLHMIRRIVRGEHPLAVNALLGLASTAESLGRPDEARAYSEQAAAAQEAIQRPGTTP